MSILSSSLSYVPQHARLEGEFLEAALPFKAIAHLTTPMPMSEVTLRGVFFRWILQLQKHHRVTLGWVLSIETQPQRHIHAGLIASVPLNCEYAATLWREMIAVHSLEAAKVVPYKRGLGGLGYSLKRLGSADECIQFSENLAVFVPNGCKSRFRTSSAQRRQQRRIREQLARQKTS